MVSRKHIYFVGLLAVLLAAALPGAAQLPPAQPDPLARMREAAGTQVCTTDDSSACAAAAPKIISSALGASPLAENLRRLTDEIGGRVTGSPSMARAVAWGVAGFRDAGVDEVRTEKFTVPITWSEGNSRVEVLSGAPFAVHLVSVAWSPATPAGGTEANLVDVGMGEEGDFARAGDAARGAILLVHSDVLRTFDGLFAEYMHEPGVLSRASVAGARGVLWMSTREAMLLYRHLSSVDGSLEKLPQAIVAREDAERLARDLAAGQKVRVRLELPNKIGGPSEQENVVAEIRGREKPDEFVVLGAHLDSWELGTGALDNGCNAALVIEAARDIHLTGLRPRHSIRFVLFGGEEQGMLGSRAYVLAHRTELDRAIAAIVLDEGTGRITGFSLGGRRDVEPGVRESLDPLASWGVNKNTYDAFFGTDNFDFLLEGVPNLVANQEDANYLPNYHAASDTYDKVDLVNLKLNTAVAGLLAFSIAEHSAPLGRRLSRSEIETLLKQTGLDTQMKTVDVWRSWEGGQRGRQP
jgi:carboxypeptidase Q